MTQFVLVLGAAGAGKTTLIANTVRRWGEEMRLAVVFNDDGAECATDLPSDMGAYADVAAMTGGCFGCADSEEFVERVRDLNGKVDIAFVEPIGFTDAEEMLTTLARAQVVPFVVAVFDGMHFARNVAIGVTDSHLAASDLAVVTKVNAQRLESEAEAFALKRGKYMVRMSESDALDVMSLKKRIRYTAVKTSCAVHGGNCSHNHHHDHDHQHLATFHARLSCETTFEMVHAVLLRYSEVIRAKGDVDEVHFDMVHGEFEVSEARGVVPFATFYTASQHRAQGEACLQALEPLYAKGAMGFMGTAAALRGDGMDLDAVEYQLDVCKRMPLTFSARHPVPNPEWQELLNEIRKRPSVPMALSYACIDVRVRHYLACAMWYSENPERIGDDIAATRLHAIAVGVAWFVSEMPQALAPELVEEAKQLPIIAMLSRGLMGRRRINQNTVKEVVIVDEAVISARWAMKCTDVSEKEVELLRLAFARQVELAEENETIKQRWLNAVLQLS